MKLSGRDAARYAARPDPDAPGLLLYGADATRVALRRQEAVAALLGPGGEEEMRLTRLAAADLRKDPAALDDAVRAQGFFPGLRVVLVEEAGDALAKTIAASLADWRDTDGRIVVTAGSLPSRSTLRKAFEDHPRAVAIGIYDDPPDRDEIGRILSAAGLDPPGGEAMADLVALAGALPPGDFRQTVEKLALYKHGDAAALQPAEIVACAPATIEADIDDMLHAVAEARTGEIGALMQRLRGQGIAPVTLCIGATRHFRTLHAAASDPDGPGRGIAKVRPPVFGPRRERMVRQAQSWGLRNLEAGLRILLDTDLALRSTAAAPQGAVIERAMIRLSMLARR